MEWGERWFEEIVAFRRNPGAYLTEHKLTEDNFVWDILQALCIETVHENTKVHLLGILQEHGSILIHSLRSIEDVVVFLQDLFQKNVPQSSAFYRGQILVTVTHLLLEYQQLEVQPELFTRFIDLLLDVVSKVNVGPNRVLRGTACECLQEIENSYPGLLFRKLEHFYQMSLMENTHVCQSYMSLFVTILKHTIEQLACSGKDSIETNRLTDLLCNRTEPLKPLTLPADPAALKLSPNPSSGCSLPSAVDTRELKKAITHLLDCLELLTPATYSYVVQKLMDIVKLAPDLSCSIFSGIILKNISSMDISLLHLLFNLKMKFGKSLFSDADDELLLERLLICLNHPSLHVGHRLLLYEWLMFFPDAEGIVSTEASLPPLLQPKHFPVFFPQVFDGTDTQLKKINALSMCFSPGEEADSSSATLMSCLVGLHKLVNYGITGRPATALFRALFIYYKRHGQSLMVKDIERFLSAIVMNHPKFVPYILEFLRCVRTVHPESPLPVAVLSCLVNHTVGLHLEETMINLSFYLQVLERASREEELQPKPILHFLLNLLKQSSMCFDGKWSMGNAILAVCRSILQYHNTNKVFVELGDVLYILFTHFEDVDIRDRAKFYYSLLTNLSSNKISTILKTLPGSNQDNTQNLSSLFTGSTNFPSASPVVNLQTPVLEWTREHIEHDRPSNKAIHPSVEPECEKGLLETYQDLVASDQFIKGIHTTYLLKMLKNECNLECLYSVVLQIHTSNSYEPVKDVYIPCLSVIEDEDSVYKATHQFQLTFTPLKPVPASFSVCAIFTSADSKTYSCHLPSVQIKFEDLFHPLLGEMEQSQFKSKLFHLLWDSFNQDWKKSDGATSSSTTSVCVLHIDQSLMEQKMNTHLSNYVVDVEDSDVRHIAIFLPPASHLLMRIKILEETSIVSIATDNWRLLPSVNKYLKSF